VEEALVAPVAAGAVPVSDVVVARAEVDPVPQLSSTRSCSTEGTSQTS
jgi:hypothetical protein